MLAKALSFDLSVEGARNMMNEVVPGEMLRQENKMIDKLFEIVCKKVKADEIA